MNKQVALVSVVIVVVVLLAVAMLYAPDIMQILMPHRPPQH
jgi:hypothetical protein